MIDPSLGATLILLIVLGGGAVTLWVRSFPKPPTDDETTRFYGENEE